MNQPWVDSLQEKHTQVQQDRDFLKQIYQLHSCLHQARLEVETQKSALDQSQVAANLHQTGAQKQQTLIQWTPMTAVAYDSAFVPENLSPFFIFGAGWLHLFQGWLQQLRWDEQQSGDIGNNGVSWFELGLSLCCHTQHLLPIQRTDADGEVWLIQPKACDILKYQILAADVANSMMQLWNAFHSLTLGCPPIQLTRGLQSSPFLLGHRSQASGFRPRPWIPCPELVIPAAAYHLSDKSSYQVPLEISWSLSDLEIEKRRWSDCKKQLKVGQSLSRRLKRATGAE